MEGAIGFEIGEGEFDLDFDGNIDLWTYRQQGKIVRQELDTNFDSKPDIWKYFENEKLVRIERSSQRNDKVDVWEYYEGGAKKGGHLFFLARAAQKGAPAAK